MSENQLLDSQGNPYGTSITSSDWTLIIGIPLMLVVSLVMFLIWQTSWVPQYDLNHDTILAISAVLEDMLDPTSKAVLGKSTFSSNPVTLAVAFIEACDDVDTVRELQERWRAWGLSVAEQHYSLLECSVHDFSLLDTCEWRHIALAGIKKTTWVKGVTPFATQLGEGAAELVDALVRNKPLTTAGDVAAAMASAELQDGWASIAAVAVTNGHSIFDAVLQVAALGDQFDEARQFIRAGYTDEINDLATIITVIDGDHEAFQALGFNLTALGG